MPDNDRFPRAIRAQWREVRRLALSVDEPARVGDLSGKAVAAVLRSQGGLPGLQELARDARDALVFGHGEVAEIADAFVDRNGRIALARYVREELQILVSLTPGDVRGMSDAELASAVGSKALRRLVKGELWSRSRDELVDRCGSVASAYDYEQRCLDSTPCEGVVKSLLAHPDGDGLRAPRRQAPVPGVDEVLEEDFSV
jgi:hypothetical protein